IGFLAKGASLTIYIGLILFTGLGFLFSPWYYLGSGFFLLFFALEFYLKFIQKKHAILRNFGFFGGIRYIMESVGPELRQYWIASDTEERPFTRRERGEVYQYAKNDIGTAAFGSMEELNYGMIRHSMYPLKMKDLEPYSLTFGEERGIESTYTINKPFIISAMSFGALGENAVRALARGAKLAGIPMNTGEGGFPKYHLMEKPDIIFQMGTAKFGVRNEDATLNEDKLKEICSINNIRMVEIKLSQGAKPGKGGLLPGSKVTPEIAELRGVKVGQDVYSPPGHVECDSPENTVGFIKRVQDVSGLPVGIKLCLGNEAEFRELVLAMKENSVFPDYISIDGAEGGTGAAPRSFMDYVGIPLFRALTAVNNLLKEEEIRDKFKLLCAGKLINPARQMKAFAYGADAVYTARGFMLAIGCIQALQCNTGSCPVGITTHDKALQRGLHIETKAKRVANYVNNLDHGLQELLAATGCRSLSEINTENLFNPWEYN
ncbi:FMN-binding glutamate synthase family protein, partial [candidate division KSB1 bacterium]